MVTTTLHLPEEVRQQAELMAQRRGISLDEFVCDPLKHSLAQVPTADSFFADHAVFQGEVPADISAEHDKYLYGDEA